MNNYIFNSIGSLKSPFSQTLNVSRDERSSENLRVHLISLSVPVMKTPLITHLHLITEPLLSSHWMQPFSQFLIQIQGPDFTLCLSIPQRNTNCTCVRSLQSRLPPALPLISSFVLICFLWSCSALLWDCFVFKFVAEKFVLVLQ